MLEDRFSITIDRLVPRGSRVVLAVSGGPDSVALLLMWAGIAPARGDILSIAHFDHKLRAGSAVDATFVESLSRVHSLAYHGGAAAVSLEHKGKSIEESARHARYEFLQSVASATGSAYIATAHHADDQVETVLHAILRGTGLRGLSGMAPRRDLANQVVLVRPFLEFRRDEIQHWLDAQNVESRLDPTNEDERLTRNRIRHLLLPLLRRDFNAKVDEAILRLAELSADATRFVESLADELLDKVKYLSETNAVELRLEPLQQADPFLIAEVFRRCIERCQWPRKHFDRGAYHRLVGLVLVPDALAIDLPSGVRAERIAAPVAVIRLTCKP